MPMTAQQAEAGLGEAGKGILALIAACTVWGLSPLYYAQLRHVPPLEVLAFRTLWSLVFFGVLLGVQGKLGELRLPFSSLRATWMTLVAGAFISMNWFGFIYAVSTGQTVESSLGYFIFPLVAVLLGRVVLGERLAVAQWVAVGLACGGVMVLTYGLGVAPWIALLLASTFGAYGLIKKRLAMGPVLSVTAEMVMLAPLALAWILLHGSVWPQGWGTHLLLALSGPLTGGPLVLFSYAARRVKLSTLGLGQYWNPTLQFLCAVFWFAEPFTVWHGIAFPLIWLGLLIYSASTIVQERAARRVVSSEGTSGTVVMNP
jgi:chloramphenicol-sensitive protein RarD